VYRATDSCPMAPRRMSAGAASIVGIGVGGKSRRQARAPTTAATAPIAETANQATSPVLVASRSMMPTVPVYALTAVPPMVSVWA